MKTKKLQKKLALEKKTVSNLQDLNEMEMIRLKGGVIKTNSRTRSIC